MDQEDEIEDGNGSELGVIEIALGGALDAADHVEELVAALRDEGVHVKGEPRLKDPETLKANGGSKAGVSDEEPGVAGEDQAEDGGEGSDAGGDAVALGLEIGGLEGGGGGGDGVLEEEESGSNAEEEIRGKGEKRGGLGEEEGKGEKEKEEENGGRLEGSEAVNRGSTLEERVGIGGEEGLVDEGDEKAEDEEVELEMVDEAVGGMGERVVRLGGVIAGRLEVVLGGGDEMVEP